MSRRISADKNTTELALAFENVIQLVDIARNDIVELDKILKTGINGQPSILIELDRLKSDIVLLECKLKTMNVQVEVLEKSKTGSDETKDHENRLKYLEKVLWTALGGLAVFGGAITYGASILKIMKEFFTVAPIVG